MAMFERRDRSAYYGSLESNSQAARKNASSEVTRSRLANSTYLNRKRIQEHSEDLQAINNVVGSVKGMFEDAFTIASGNLTPLVGEKLNSLIHMGQQADANTDLLEIVTKGKGIAENSIMDGSSMFTIETDPDGTQHTVFKPSEAFQSWYDDAVKQIEESSYLPDVKAAYRKSLDSNYFSLLQGMQSSSIERMYQGIQSNYETQMTAAEIQDAQLWAQYDGKLPEGVTYSGMAVIAGRQDLTDQEKLNAAEGYIVALSRAGIQEKAVQISTGAASYNGKTGMEAANEYIYSQRLLNSDQKISISSKANTAYQQIKQGYLDEVDSMMAETFTDPGGSSPYDVYEWIDNVAKTNHLPDSMVTELKDQAYKTQTEGATAAVANSLAFDKNLGYSALLSTRENISNGTNDNWFYDRPDLKQAALATYDAEIQSYKEKLATELDTTTENIEKMDQKVLDAYEDATNYAFTLFDNGDITGRQYAEMITAAGQTALGASQTKDVPILNGWRTAFSKTREAYVEEVFGDKVDDVVEAILVAEGAINKDKNKRTVEELRMIDDLIAETNGSILNALWDHGKNGVPIESVLDFAERAYQSFVLKESVIGKDNESNIPLPTDPGVTMKKVITTTAENNSKITSNPEASYVWYDHGDAYASSIEATTDENGQITLTQGSLDSGLPKAYFLDAATAEDYRRTVNVYRSQLAMALGISEEELMGADNPEAVGENAAIASPVFYFNGHAYRPRGLMLQEFVDTGTPGDGKGEWVTFAVIRKDGTGSDLIREPAGMPQPEAVDMSLISRNNFKSFITVERPDGELNATPTGINIDRRILDAKNYSESMVLSLVRDDPELRSFRQLIQRQLKYLENSRTEEN